jgi:hypothetical protein
MLSDNYVPVKSGAQTFVGEVHAAAGFSLLSFAGLMPKAGS